MKINNLDASAYLIGADEYRELLDGDLSEVCEFHSRGFLVELIAVSVRTQFTDSGEFDGIVIAAGDIDGSEYHRDDLHNITCIGSGFERIGHQRYYAIEFGKNDVATRNECIAFAASLIAANERTPTSV
jgi:hypothetical protein